MNKSLENKEAQKVLQCLYCGNKTKMDMVGQHIYRWEDDEGCYCGVDIYKMFSCPICEKVTFHYAYWENGMYGRNGEMIEEEEILYPVNSIDSKAMPQKIKDSFEAAIKIRNIDNAVCLMALRRTLELVCVDKGATEWGLKDKIKELVQNGILPDFLREASSFTKILGDSAAHDKGFDLNNHDINIIIDFVEYIIEYLYVLPYKLEKYKRRLKSLEEELNDE
ncbi:MAG: DUF4145 domain-containing protein [Oscillospiraceae bacterium]|nr:DUF4145 domain-containing protein [Oscillospiraceae bacterium]